jgi:hypothetical protein
MRSLLVVVLSFFLLASSAFARPEQSVVRDYARLVVLNKPTFANKTIPVGSGSAIVIAPGYALSAWHVFQTAENFGFSVTAVEGSREINLKVVKKDEESDLVLISGDFQCPCAPLATAMPDLDERVLVVGYPLYSIYQLQFMAEGTYQGLMVERNKAAMNGHAAPGSSGGGVFYKENGKWRLFGILESIGAIPLGPSQLKLEQQLNWISFAVPLPVIQKLLEGTDVKVQ